MPSAARASFSMNLMALALLARPAVIAVESFMVVVVSLW